MNHLVDSYIESVLSNVRYKKIHPSLAKELYDHIECSKEELEKEGLSEDEAYKKAVDQMGDATKLGKDLHQLHKPRLDVLLVLLMSLVVLCSICLMKISGNENLIGKQIVYMGIGIVGFLIMYHMDYTKMKRYSYVFIGISIFLLSLVFFMGRTINGARRWLNIGPVSLTIVAITIPLFMIGFIGCLIKNQKSFQSTIIFVLGSFLCICLTLNNYLVEGIFLTITLYLTCICYLHRQKESKLEKQYKLWMTLIILAGISLVIIGFLSVYLEGYRMTRIVVWRNVEEDPRGYLMLQMLNIKRNASWFGNTGIQVWNQNHSTTFGPFYTQDFSIVGIMGYFGYFAAVVVISILLAMVVRAFLLAKKQKDDYGYLLMFAISLFFAFQVVPGILMQFNYLPAVGVNLPFLTYDGTTIIFEFMLLGFFLSIHRRKDIHTEELVAE